MPHLKSTITDLGPIVKIGVAITQPRERALKNAGVTPPEVVVADALIDTGASCSAVDPEILDKLELPPKGMAKVLTPSTGDRPVTVPLYDVRIP